MSMELTTTESRSLAKHERVIGKGLGTFVAVGMALAAIRNGDLYKATHERFADYCHERWEISKSHANRLIDASGITESLTPIGVILPFNEAQARPLAGVAEQDRADVWREVVATAPMEGDEPRITAEHVADVVEKLRVKPPKPRQPEPVAGPVAEPSGVELEQLQDAFDTHVREQYDAADELVQDQFKSWVVRQ